MTRTRPGAALVAVLALAAACAAGEYAKPGGTYSEWKRDDAECRKAAWSQERGHDREAYARCMRERGYRIRND